MANKLAPKHMGPPCTRNPAHVTENGQTLRYDSNNTCVACTIEAAKKSTDEKRRKRAEAEERGRAAHGWAFPRS